MATYAQRAKAIVGALRNKLTADVTDAEVNRCARSLAFRMDPVSGLAQYDALTDAAKVQFYVERMFAIQLSAVQAMDAEAAAATATIAARNAAATELAPAP